MKVILLKPPVKVNQVYNVIPPLGLGYLATALRLRGHDVSILDAIKDRLDVESTIKRINETCPDVVGYQTFSYDVGMVKKLSLRLKSTGVIQIIGGPHPSGMGRNVLSDFPNINYAMVGEGERSLPDLLDRLQENKNPDISELAKIPGLVGHWGATEWTPPCFEPEIDSLGFPAWDLHPPKQYPFAPQGAIFRQWPLAPIVITRGCPYPCTFCAGHTLSGKKLRHRSVEHVIEEMHILTNAWGVREFHILDDNFSLNRGFFMAWCKAVREHFPGITWCAPNGMRLDTLDEEVVRAMIASGCYYVSVGIESGSDRILKQMRKGFTVDDVRRRVSMIKRQGLDVNGFFILGYPGETLEDMEATIRLSLDLDLSRAAYFNFLPLPGTPIFEDLNPNGIPDGMWDSYFQFYAPYAPDGISPVEVKKMQRAAHLRFYLRWKIFIRMLREIRSLRQLYWIFRRASKILGAGADIVRTKAD